MSNTTDFWNWFREHNYVYLFIDDLEDEARENLFDELLDQLHLYCDQLYFELGGMLGKTRNLLLLPREIPTTLNRLNYLLPMPL